MHSKAWSKTRILVVAGLACLCLYTSYNAFVVLSAQFIESFPDYSCCWSSDAAERKGVIVARVRFEPSTFTWDEQEIEVGDAWIEEEAQTQFNWALQPYHKRIGTYRLCFRLDKGNEVLWGVGAPIFLHEDNEGAGVGITASGGEFLFSKIVSSSDQAGRHVRLVRGFTEQLNCVKLTIEPK